MSGLKPKGTCPECRREISLRIDGTIRQHSNPKARGSWMNCSGWGKHPAGHWDDLDDLTPEWTI